MSYQQQQKNTINNNQNADGNKKKGEHQGGFVPYIHTMQEKIYGPQSPLPCKTKLFLCIQHLILRNWEHNFHSKGMVLIPKKLMEKTGIKTKSNFNRYLKELIKEKLILTKEHNGQNWYFLHPDTFGKDYIYEPGRKKSHLQVVPDLQENDDQDDSSDIQVDSKSNQFEPKLNQFDYPPIQESAPIAPSETQKSLQEPFQEPIQEGKIISFKKEVNPKDIMDDWFSRNGIMHLRRRE